MVDRSRAALGRLAGYLDLFAGCFHRRVQRGAVRRYVEGLFGPSARKNLARMWAETTDAGNYQTLQHFITTSPWSDEAVWRRLRKVVPERRGILISDDTGIPKKGTHSVGVQRQYSGTLGKIDNCQIAVTTVLRTARWTWPLAMDLYLPEVWANDPARRSEAEIPGAVRYRPKWKISLAQIEKVRRSGFEIECVVADAGYGDSAEYRLRLARKGLSYVVRVKSTTAAWVGSPRFVEPKKNPVGRPRTRRLAQNNRKPRSVAEIAGTLAADAWKTIRWRGGSGAVRRGVFAALRVTPSHGWTKWYRGRRNPEGWLLVERRKNETKYYLSNLPSDTSLLRLVELAKARWAVEQNYRDLKDELGFDHFEGRRWNGWHHHAVLTALTFTFLELERRRGGSPKGQLTRPAVRRFTRTVFSCLLIAGNKKLFQLTEDFHRHPPTWWTGR